MGTYYGLGNGFRAQLARGVFAVGARRYACGLCPTCQQLNESEVEKRFAALRGGAGAGPGAMVTKMRRRRRVGVLLEQGAGVAGEAHSFRFQISDFSEQRAAEK